MNISLRFINNSRSTNDQYVIFLQKNIAIGSPDEIATAWRVFDNYMRDMPVHFSESNTINVSDSWGNTSPSLSCAPGQRFVVSENSSGLSFALDGTADDRKQVEVSNALQVGVIDVNIYKDGKRLAANQGISPGHKAAFEFQPTIWMGVTERIEEGDIINSAIISQLNTEISLIGIAGADIVLTGGGVGKDSVPFIFTLQNIKYE